MKTSIKQQGMALFVSLIFLLLLTLLGMAAMKSASFQEKMAGNVKWKNETFQTAEGALLAGEAFLANAANATALTDCGVCSGAGCQVPTITGTISAVSGACAAWKAVGDTGTAFYQIQKLGVSTAAINTAGGSSVMLYRVTALADKGSESTRTALESIYAKAN